MGLIDHQIAHALYAMSPTILRDFVQRAVDLLPMDNLSPFTQTICLKIVFEPCLPVRSHLIGLTYKMNEAMLEERHRIQKESALQKEEIGMVEQETKGAKRRV